LLAELGHEILDAPQPFGPEAVESFEVVWAVLGALPPVPPQDEERLMPLTRWLRGRGRAISGVRYAEAFAGMQSAARRAAQVWEPFDVLLSPTLAGPPSRVGEIRDDDDPAADFEAQKRFSPYCAVYNVTGQPAISLPLHWTGEDVPVGVMIGGRRGADAVLISLAAQLEQARPWRDRRPRGW
jgi:amidase